MARSTENTPVPATEDGEAWCAAAANRKYCIKDGQVWSGTNGMLFPLPALPGFGALPATVRPLVFHAVAQFATYRVGQNATGNVAAVVSDAIVNGTIPAAKTNDALEAHYVGEISDRVDAKFGVINKKSGASAEEIKARQDAVVVTADKYRDQLFAEITASGIEAAQNKPTGDKKPRANKAKSTDALEI